MPRPARFRTPPELDPGPDGTQMKDGRAGAGPTSTFTKESYSAVNTRVCLVGEKIWILVL